MYICIYTFFNGNIGFYNNCVKAASEYKQFLFKCLSFLSLINDKVLYKQKSIWVQAFRVQRWRKIKKYSKRQRTC